ncbi:MAG: D-alanine--D-alanine ligase [Bacteroidota bacterium]|nr:D-alanine--D-alanine ligase [Bacteroidota bacterium]MDP4212129.1 D-alanine--D-alanine ligase [Bacteroidota bacterium]MDP4249477.1 D-alanine--D-alanine ligase [Bacteroidota bacterium]
MNGDTRLRSRICLIRLLHWEYWSFHLIYLPIYPIWLFLCLRARSLFFFAASNPGIRNGGFLSESKQEIYDLIPQGLQPKTLFFKSGEDPQTVMDRLRAGLFHFPLIGKPNIGGRGRGVRKLLTEEEVKLYAAKSGMDFHIQEFVSHEQELGIFYYRFPDQQQGRISGIVGKEFLTVTGDGQSSVRELLMLNPRGILQLPALDKNSRGLLMKVPAKKEVLTVVPYGNHARGAKFLDDSDRLTQELSQTIDSLCARIPDFYYGRLDIRYRNRTLLDAGRDFVILEVNGAGSEPTHIYDPRHSLFFAWKEIVRHWIILFKISRTNHRRGYPYLSFSEGLRMLREDRLYSKQLELMKNIE